MPTFSTVDATWTTSMTMDQDELKRADTTGFLGDGTANGVRSGVVRHADTSLAVTVNGSDQVTVQPGAFVIAAPTGLGCYRGSLPAAVGPGAGTALTARNATNPRIDLVVIQMSSGSAIVKTIDGTPSSSPVAPALPAQHIELARLTVPAVGGGAVTVDSTFRAYTTGLGGVLFVETAARLPSSGNQKGQRAIALDTGFSYTHNGTQWARRSTELGYAEITSVYTSPTPASVVDVPGLAVTVDLTGQPIWVEFQVPVAHTSSTALAYLITYIREGSTTLQSAQLDKNDTRIQTLTGAVRITPSAGSHTYKLSIFTDNSATGVSVQASASAIAWIRVRAA